MKRVFIDKVPVDSITMGETLARISILLGRKDSPSLHIVTPNAQFLQIARTNGRFAEILLGADLSVADGVPLVWASRLLGQPLPGRVNGTDLMVRLSELAAKHHCSVYFLGGRPGAAEAAALKLQNDFPGFRIAGVDCPPMNFMEDAELDGAVSERIRRASPDILFVGLGAPKQEYWIHDHADLPARVKVGIGGSFELVAGVTKRAPLLLQKSGFEWLWRLAMEPRRLFKRYLVGNSLFVIVVLRQFVGGYARRREVPMDRRSEAERQAE